MKIKYKNPIHKTHIERSDEPSKSAICNGSRVSSCVARVRMSGIILRMIFFYDENQRIDIFNIKNKIEINIPELESIIPSNMMAPSMHLIQLSDFVKLLSINHIVKWFSGAWTQFIDIQTI